MKPPKIKRINIKFVDQNTPRMFGDMLIIDLFFNKKDKKRVQELLITKKRKAFYETSDNRYYYFIKGNFKFKLYTSYE